MKQNVWVKAAAIMLLLLSIVSGVSGGTAHAEGNYSLSNGTYIAGIDTPSGLIKFTIPSGSAEISISRGDENLVSESLSNDYYSPHQFTASLKDGDQIEVYLYDDASNVTVQKVSRLDLNKLSSGFYEIGTDIPAGTYTVKMDHPADDYDAAYLTFLDNQNQEKDYEYLYPGENPFDSKFSNGDKIYLSNLRGTISLKEKILVPQSISINKTSLSLMVNRTAALTAVVNPSTAINKAVSWTSSNPAIATVDSKGNVKAIKIGTATITATAQGASSIKKSIPVTVTKVIPSSMKLSRSTLNIVKNQTFKVSATITPTDSVNKAVVWKSSNTKVATADSKGNIKGVGNGTAVIKATTADNSKVYKTITVKVSTKTVKVNRTSVSVTAGKTVALTATVSPSDSTDKTVKWKSSNTRIATVDSKGKITGKAKGTATISASVKGAKEVKVKVTVTPPVAAKSVKLNKTSVTLYKGKTVTLTATVSPSNTTVKTVKWKSSNTKVAKVDSKGKVTATGAGKATITATTSNGKKATASITVPYVKNLSTGTWKAGRDLPAGRYKITTSSGYGNLVIGMGTENRFVNEVLSSENDGFGVTVVTTDIKSGDSIEISGLRSVQFEKVSNVISNTLHAGNWTVGKDINAGRYKITTTSGEGNLIITRGSGSLLVNEILAVKSDGFSVSSVTTTLKSGDHIWISGLNKVIFSKK